MNGWVDGWMDGWVGGWADASLCLPVGYGFVNHSLESRICRNEWMGGWMGGNLDGWMDGWVQGWVHE
jgi:hypothetical protein